ncbi:MAG: lytic transglycosylase domain-containing protein [Ruminococcaceae bacterium]|nr:lytic transglycosylase domain-containing protein [Oscillospiraceae bacterium]
MRRFDMARPSRSVMIALILVVAVLFGLLADLIWTGFEKLAYPKKYSDYVETYAKQYNVPPHVLYAVIKTESGFDSAAVSKKGAVGLMQFMPDTFDWLTNEMLFEHLADGMRYDPETSVRYGAYLLSHLYKRYGNWSVALAAYNAGIGTVDKWLEDPTYADSEGGLKAIPYKETRNYIKKVTKAQATYDRLYGVPEAEVMEITSEN